MTPEFLTLEEVLTIQARQIALFGGDEGLRDSGLLESAISQPKAQFGGHYLHRDLFEMAAAYLFHLVMNHPFVDGNKRVGLMSAMHFLELNGVSIDVPIPTLVDFVIGVTQGVNGKPEITEFFRTHTSDADHR